LTLTSTKTKVAAQAKVSVKGNARGMGFVALPEEVTENPTKG
jgi:hypothetical protein